MTAFIKNAIMWYWGFKALSREKHDVAGRKMHGCKVEKKKEYTAG